MQARCSEGESAASSGAQPCFPEGFLFSEVPQYCLGFSSQALLRGRAPPKNKGPSHIEGSGPDQHIEDLRKMKGQQEYWQQA